MEKKQTKVSRKATAIVTPALFSSPSTTPKQGWQQQQTHTSASLDSTGILVAVPLVDASSLMVILPDASLDIVQSRGFTLVIKLCTKYVSSLPAFCKCTAGFAICTRTYKYF